MTAVSRTAPQYLYRPRRIAAGLHPIVPRLAVFAALAMSNWLLASQFADPIFSWTSLALYAWLVLLVARISRRAAILFAPFIITRLATVISLIAIEAGAYMPEINRAGAPGDASASFVVFTAIFFLSFAGIFRIVERPMTAWARSPLLDGIAALFRWPVVLVCIGWGALAFLHGAAGGFPLIEGMDRFLYRRFYSDAAVLLLLDNKQLAAGLLGLVAFAPRASRLQRFAATMTFVALTGLYFLFGDKFFTILTEAAFFMMPYLLRNEDRLPRLVARLALPAIGLTTFAGAMSLYIYSDYGRLPLDRTLQAAGERVAGQGELWFIATRDYARPVAWDASLVARYIDVLDDKAPPTSAFRNGVETYFFVQHYSPAKLAAQFRRYQGWVQLVMGTEAMALVMFGYVGVAIVMLIMAGLVALAAAYLERGFRSGFPLSLFFAVWAYLQVMFAGQQASLWTVAAPGQIKRFLLFFVIEFVLLAINRGAVSRVRRAVVAARAVA